MAAARNPMKMTVRPPSIIWISTSLPSLSVPSRCPGDPKGSRISLTVGATDGVKIGPIKLISTSSITMTKPMKPAGLRRSDAMMAPKRPTLVVPMAAAGPPLATDSAISSPLRLATDPDPRIQPAVEDVGQQVGDHHRERDDQEDPLQYRVVATAERIEQAEPDALVAEDPLHEDRPADHEPE